MADINKKVGIEVEAKSNVDEVVNKSQKSIENYDKTLKDSAKSAKSAGDAAAKGAKGFGAVGTQALASSKKLTTAANSSKKSLNEVNRAWELLGTKSTKTYNRELQRLDAAFKRIKNSGTASAKDIERAHKALIKQQKEIQKSIKGTEKSFSSLGDVVGALIGNLATIAAAAGVVITPIVETAQFNASMAQVKAVLGDVTENEFAELNAVARELGATTAFSAQEAAAGLQFLAQAGFSATEAMEALPGVLNLAQAGNLGLGEAADIASNILTGMGLEVSELGRVNDVLVQGFTSTNTSLSELGFGFSYVAPIAASFGVSVEETTTALGLLSNAGIKSSMAGTTLRGILVKLAKPSKEGAAVMQEIAARIGQTSLEITDANGKFLSLGKIIGQFEDAGLTASEAVTILGQRAGPGLAALVSQGADSFDELNDKMLTSAGRTDAIAKILRDTLVGDFKSAQSAVSELALSIGDQLVPAARAAVQIFSDMVTFASDLIKDYPTLTKLVIGLGVALAGLVTAFSTVSIGKALAPLIAVQWGAMITNVKAFTTALIVGFGKSKTAVLAFTASNPVLAGIAVTLAAVTAAWALFGESSGDAAEKHQDAAEAIGVNRAALQDQITELEKIQRILSDESAGSEQFIAAQQRMAELVPGTNVYLDEQGRLLANVGTKGEEASEGLQKYINQLKEDEQFAFTDQLEQQQKAFQESGEGLKEYKENLEDWYGIGQDSTSLVQDFFVGLNKLTGTYRRNIDAGTELQESYKQSATALDQLLTQAQQAGLSVEDLTESLQKNQVGAKESNAIIARYTQLLQGTEEANKSAGDSATQSNQQVIRSVKELEAELKTFEGESKKFGKELSAQNRIAADSMKQVEGGYTQLAEVAKSRYDSELQAIETVKQARLAGLSGQTAGQRIDAETQITLDAYDSRLEALRSYTQESEALMRQEEQTRRGLADQGAENPLVVEQDLLNKRKAFYTQTVASYRSMITQMISEEKRHLDAVASLEAEKKNLRSSTEDRIRELRRQGLTEEEQYQDKIKQADEKQSAAKRALAEGDLEAAKKLNEEAQALAESSVKAESDSVNESEAAASVEKTIAELKESEQIGQEILDQMLNSHQEAADQIAGERENLQIGLQEAEQKLVDLNTQLQEMATAEIEVQVEQVNEAIALVNELSEKLNDIDGKVSRAKVVITEQTVQARAGGGPASPLDFPRLGSSLVSRGSGLRDDVPAMLTRGEWVLPRDAVTALIKKGGAGIMAGLNRGMLPVQEVVQNFAPSPSIAVAGIPQLKAAPGDARYAQFGTIRIENDQTGDRYNIFTAPGDVKKIVRDMNRTALDRWHGSGRKGPRPGGV